MPGPCWLTAAKYMGNEVVSADPVELKAIWFDLPLVYTTNLKTEPSPWTEGVFASK